jgi:hypothetical protein
LYITHHSWDAAFFILWVNGMLHSLFLIKKVENKMTKQTVVNRAKEIVEELEAIVNEKRYKVFESDSYSMTAIEVIQELVERKEIDREWLEDGGYHKDFISIILNTKSDFYSNHPVYRELLSILISSLTYDEKIEVYKISDYLDQFFDTQIIASVQGGALQYDGAILYKGNVQINTDVQSVFFKHIEEAGEPRDFYNFTNELRIVIDNYVEATSGDELKLKF